jgi:NitT/TauT family transport system ATP-binding protein
MRSWGVPEEKHGERIDTYLEMVGLTDTADSYPGDLSGGMQQRIGIARALAVGSDVILMDEPFSSLDEITAADLRADLIDLWQKTNKTILFITHDLSEAVYLSDRVFFLGPNGSLLNKYSVDVPRPRSVDNDALIQIESDLRSVLHETIEQGA